MVISSEYHQVTERLCFWQAYDPAVKCDLSCVAYRSLAGWVLIDPIKLKQELLSDIFGEERVLAILLTNGNHTRASAWYRKNYGGEIWAAEAAVKELEVAPDRLIVEGGEVFGLKCLPISGAVVGETAFLAPEGYLFLGDSVINLESHGFALLPAKYCQDARQNRLSLKTLLDYEFSIVTFAHGLPLRQKAKEQLRALLQGG